MDIVEEMGAVLWTRWAESPHDEHLIVGCWAEDGSTYEIRVPEQLRSLIVQMQNALADKFSQFDTAKREYTRLRRELEIVAGKK